MAAEITPDAASGEKKAFTVVIAVDASAQAEYALNFYFDNLHMPDNRLILVHVIELPDLAHSREVYMSPGQVAELWEEEKKKSAGLEEKFRQIVRARGCDGVKMRKEGGMKPGSVVVKCANDEKANMVVMGTRGMGVVRRTILGSVSDYVVHHAHCPVVICRQGEAKKHHHHHHHS